jgi:hypothetical protein
MCGANVNAVSPIQSPESLGAAHRQQLSMAA